MYLGYMYGPEDDVTHCLIKARSLPEAQIKFMKWMGLTKKVHFKDYGVKTWHELWEQVSREGDTWEVTPLSKLISIKDVKEIG